MVKRLKGKEPDFLELKVYKNKNTGQNLVMLPKKGLGEIPKKVKILKWRKKKEVKI